MQFKKNLKLNYDNRFKSIKKQLHINFKDLFIGLNSYPIACLIFSFEYVLTSKLDIAVSLVRSGSLFVKKQRIDSAIFANINKNLGAKKRGGFFSNST